MLKHEGKQWILYDSTGKKVLGRHPTQSAGLAQEIAIRISKARKAGHKIPRQKK